MELLKRVLNSPTVENQRILVDYYKEHGLHMKEQEENVEVTFLFEGDEDTERVSIFGEIFIEDETCWLKKIDGTNLFYRTFLFPKGSRSLYVYFVNEEEGQGFDELDHRLDQFNKKINVCIKDKLHPTAFVTAYQKESVLEVTGYVEKYNRDYVPIQDVEHTTYFYNSERQLWKYGQSDTLVVFFDGFEYLYETAALEIIDKLNNEGQDISALFIGNRFNRMVEANCDNDYSDFVEALIKKENPKNVILVGFSLTCCLALYLSTRDFVGKFLLQSGAFYWSPLEDEEPEKVITYIKNNPVKDKKFFISAGILEKGYGSFYEKILETKDLLTIDNQVKFVEHLGGHVYYDCNNTLEDGLRYLLKEEI